MNIFYVVYWFDCISQFEKKMTKENKFKSLRFCWLLLTLIEILVKFAGHLAGNSKSECHNLNSIFSHEKRMSFWYVRTCADQFKSVPIHFASYFSG